MIRAFILMAGLGLLAACHSTEIRQCAYHDDPIPEHVILTIQSEILDEPRTIPVYTPPGYQVMKSVMTPIPCSICRMAVSARTSRIL